MNTPEAKRLEQFQQIFGLLPDLEPWDKTLLTRLERRSRLTLTTLDPDQPYACFQEEGRREGLSMEYAFLGKSKILGRRLRDSFWYGDDLVTKTAAVIYRFDEYEIAYRHQPGGILWISDPWATDRFIEAYQPQQPLGGICLASVRYKDGGSNSYTAFLPFGDPKDIANSVTGLQKGYQSPSGATIEIGILSGVQIFDSITGDLLGGPALVGETINTETPYDFLVDPGQPFGTWSGRNLRFVRIERATGSELVLTVPTYVPAESFISMLNGSRWQRTFDSYSARLR